MDYWNETNWDKWIFGRPKFKFTLSIIRMQKKLYFKLLKFVIVNFWSSFVHHSSQPTSKGLIRGYWSNPRSPELCRKELLKSCLHPSTEVCLYSRKVNSFSASVGLVRNSCHCLVIHLRSYWLLRCFLGVVISLKRWSVLLILET